MAEMLIQSESLASIADQIRVLSGTTEPMGLDAMESHVGEANTDVATEADLIAQITAALEGKAAGGGESGGGSAMQIASGTYILTTEHNSAKQITISGLEFAPKSLIVHLGNKVGQSSYASRGTYILASLQVGELFDYSVTGIEISNTTLTPVDNCNDNYNIQLTPDGFILSFPNAEYTVSASPYFYHAFG